MSQKKNDVFKAEEYRTSIFRDFKKGKKTKLMRVRSSENLYHVLSASIAIKNENHALLLSKIQVYNYKNSKSDLNMNRFC